MRNLFHTSLIFNRVGKTILAIGINTYFALGSFSQETTPTDTSSLYAKVIAKTSAVEDPARQVGGIDPNAMPSLPIGIVKDVGDTKVIICIDSAYFLKDAAYFSAYMALEFPNANKKIAFAAKDIRFNPEGVQGGDLAKLQLVSRHDIELGPNTVLHLPDDGSNYVNWGCNGFESVNLHGRFIFSKKVIEPLEYTAIDTAAYAEFEVNVIDVHNLMTQVNFTPFKAKGLDGFEFNVTDASVDMSDYANPPGVIMPPVYNELYPGNIDLWRGFHIKYFEVQLPEAMSAHDEPTEIYAQDLFIDDAGVTGSIGANNVLSLGAGKTDGNWGFSIDNLEIGLTTNELTKGGMAGSITVPLMDNNSLEYAALITRNPNSSRPNYNFSVNTENSMSASAFNSTLTLDSTSVLTMSIVGEKFKPQLVLNGDWKLDKENAKFEGIKFQSITINSQQPYVSNGSFGLVSPVTSTMGGFSVALNQLDFGIYNDGLVGVKAGVGLNFSKEENLQGSTGQDSLSSTNLSVTGGFEVKALVDLDAQQRAKFEFDSFKINDIAITAETNAFQLNGAVSFKQNDPNWGNGFVGSASMKVKNVLDDPIAMYCAFGKVNDYRYWAIDVTAPMPGDGIPLGNLYLTSLSGGLSWHMKDSRTVADIMTAANAPGAGTNSEMSATYTPDPNVSLGFSAGVGYVYNKEEVLHGEVIFGIQFNSNGGLSSILLAGDAYNMVKKANRATSNNYIKGAIAIGYDNQEKIFDMQMSANAEFAGALSATIWSQLYISPNLWYFHLGTPNNPCSVNLVNLVSINAYFMFGQNLPPMPPPPPQVSSVLGGFSSSRDGTQIASGNGIGLGANFFAGVDGKQVPVFGNWYAYFNGYIGAGFDMTLYKYAETSHCAGSTEPFGANYWFMNGQLYAYGGVSAGAKRIVDDVVKQDFPVISASMAMLLQGKFPKPSYIYGGINMQANVLNIFNLDLTMDFDAGTDCQIVN